MGPQSALLRDGLRRLFALRFRLLPGLLLPNPLCPLG
jgi:hypothetical protein